MFKFLGRQLAKLRSTSPWYSYGKRPPEYPPDHYRGDRGFYRQATPHEANTLSAVYAAKDLFKRSIALCPLVTYRKEADGGRYRAKSHPAYAILHDRMNAVQNRITFMEKLVEDYFSEGEFFALIIWKNNNNLHGIYALPHSNVVDVKLVVDDESGDWRKVYHIRENNNDVNEYLDEDIIHIIKDHGDDIGLRGKSLLNFASENLGLHRQIMESGNAFYKNAANPSMYVNQLAPGDLETRRREQKEFNDCFGGVRNSGKVPFVANSEINAFPSKTAEEAQIIEAMGASVADVARWFGVSPLLLADLSRGTYSNLAADNASFVQKSLQPLFEKIQLEVNLKLFGPDADTYAEFLTEAVLRGSPKEMQEVLNGYIQSGVMLRSEAREMLNMVPIPGLDVPLQPLNQGATSVVNQEAEEPAPTPPPAETLTISDPPEARKKPRTRKVKDADKNPQNEI